MNSRYRLLLVSAIFMVAEKKALPLESDLPS